MTGFRNAFQHLFNPLHVYCRLRRLGFALGSARTLCRVYERSVYRFIA